MKTLSSTGRVAQTSERILATARAVVIGFCLCSNPGVAANSVDYDMLSPEVVELWPGGAPGTEDWDFPEYVGRNSITNVTVPTLTVFRPSENVANGTAVIVVPGGAFQGLAIRVESDPTVAWLTARGITAFALKYRVRHNPGANNSPGDDFDARARELESGRRIAVADALQAMRYLRENARRYAIDPQRIGMIGFSAGAMTTMGVVMEGAPTEIPDFAAVVYGAMPDGIPPENGSPLFIVHAQDDQLVTVGKSLDIFTRWTAAGLPAELHIYEKGGHGFGALVHNQPSDQWLEAFAAWLHQGGWTSARQPN